MKRYQILEVREKEQHAGSKAVDDASQIASKLSYEVIRVKCRDGVSNSIIEKVLRYITPFPWWISAAIRIKRDSIVFLQHNGKTSQLGKSFFIRFIKRKKCKIISLVHDVEPLRFGVWNGQYGSVELKQLKLYSDEIIVHNRVMKDYFVEKGFDDLKLVELEIFDYLKDESTKVDLTQSSDVVIAGNLMFEKSPYVYNLSNISSLIFGLYGPNYSGTESENVKYFGSFPSDLLPTIIKGKYGLVWDGDSLKTCSGITGNYLKYNNPHKTSLYIVSRLPIIIWDEAAMATYVKDKGLGVTVKSIYEIKDVLSEISDSEYQLMKNNIEIEANKLEDGLYLRTAILECEKRL